MAIPDFFGQSQQSLRTGTQLGNALQNAESLRLQREQAMRDQQFQSQLRPIQLERAEMQNEQMRAEDERKGMIQDVVLLSALDEEAGKKLIPELINKYEGNEAVLAGLRDIYQSTGRDYIKKNILAVSALTGKPVGGQDARTATQKEFDQYLQLKNEDPASAKEFGMAAGFISDKGKRLFQVKTNADGSTTKYYSDGSEEIVSPKTKVKTSDMNKAMTGEKAIQIIDKAKEGQLKNAGFALTLNDGLEQTRNMIKEGYDPSSAAWVAKYLEGTTIGNLVMSEQDQMFVGSVEQMINAIARRETGAAITEFERKDFFQRYLPMPGDSKARQDQKQKALERQFRSIRGQAGSVYDAIRLTQFSGDNNKDRPVDKLQIGTVEGGYRYKGGDPSLESSWEKVNG